MKFANGVQNNVQLHLPSRVDKFVKKKKNHFDEGEHYFPQLQPFDLSAIIKKGGGWESLLGSPWHHFGVQRVYLQPFIPAG